jgi:catechol 2,3-dioxygenase-like lactoylglutathione lyase family enzyme
MAIQVVEIHHYALHMHPQVMEATYAFYRDSFGVEAYSGRPDLGAGCWVDMPGDIQIHILGEESGPSRFAKGPDKDPVHPHVAYGVADIVDTLAELRRLEIDYWTLNSEVLPQLTQAFFRDPAGNLIELHQVGYCRCKKSERK